jgi:ABC-2 type transport system permease protein
LVLPAAATVVMLVLAARIQASRDVGAGLLAARDSAPPNLRLLSSPTALAARSLSGGLLAWVAAIAAFALILGVVSDSVAAGISESLQAQLRKLGTNAGTASGFLGLVFSFFVLAISLFACFELGAVRDEESEQRLETLLAQPVGRGRWLALRLALVAAGAALLALVAAAFAWAGAESQGAGVSVSSMLEAGVNCLPVALLFLGAGALAFALVPRAARTIAYALVGVAFLWALIGGLLQAPAWLLALSPFHDARLVPAEPFATTAAAIMAAAGLVAAAAAVWAFRRRDLVAA